MNVKYFLYIIVIYYKEYIYIYLKKQTGHTPCIHPFVNITTQILFVEAHGRDYGACGPIYHDICQKVIQGKFSMKR